MVTNVEEEQQQQWRSRGVGVVGSARRDSNEDDDHMKKICFHQFSNLPEFVSRNAVGYAIRIASEAIGGNKQVKKWLVLLNPVEYPIDELVTLKHISKSAQRNILSRLSVSWSSDYGSSF
ncbi:hypothetical protein LWI29_030913 [Acer saccharum]|uniref:Uncharacterized protein n=1 Tax=Acer saccharum TaxID=4024 RepID=A0AA39SY75_ACESA|nr:hypothetical protein LWI29_030913 [Acer saccharum]